jgi:hypothetical protein
MEKWIDEKLGIWEIGKNEELMHPCTHELMNF